MTLDAGSVKSEINRISKLKNISYERLMEENMRVLGWAKQHLKDKETQEKIKEIKKSSLKISIKRIANGNPIYNLFLTKYHPAIERASREVYVKQNRKTSIQQLIEDADCVYYQRHKFRSLKQFLEDIIKIGDKPNDFTADIFYRKEQGLGRALKNKFGSIGKAVMLLGIDYTQKGNTMTRRSRYSYSLGDFFMISNDTSLDENEKIACIFNALSLQHYELGIFSQPERVFGEIDNETDISRDYGNVKVLRQRNSKRFPIIIRWLGSQKDSGIVSDNASIEHSVELSLSNGVKNRFHKTIFYFNETHSKMDSYKMYLGLDRILGNLGL